MFVYIGKNNKKTKSKQTKKTTKHTQRKSQQQIKNECGVQFTIYFK